MNALFLFVWIMSISFSIYSFSKACEDYKNVLNEEDFIEGWPFLGRLKDNSDAEWRIITNSFKKYWFVIAIQIACKRYLLNPDKIFYFDAVFSLLFLLWIIGIYSTLIFLCYVAIMYICSMSGYKSLCYAITFISLMCLHQPYVIRLRSHILENETEEFLFETTTAWLLAKGLSFSVDLMEMNLQKKFNLYQICSVIAYSFYIPTVFTGPILLYSKFWIAVQESQVNQEKNSSNQYFKLSLLHLVYQLCWYFIYELMLHFLHSSALQFYPDLVVLLDNWSFFGLGYVLPLLFYLKYFIIYGVSGSIARIDGFELPPPPKCISVVHRSSFLWRHFDRGLYLWILRYIYFPIVDGSWTLSRKSLAMFFTYVFVCTWHGMDKPVIMFCFMNFALVLSENRELSQYIELGNSFRNLPGLLKRFLRDILSLTHFILMCISCIFFLSNYEVGWIFMERVFSGNIIPFVPLALVMHCGCQVSGASTYFQKYEQLSVKVLLK